MTDNKKRNPAAIIANMILQKTWDWDEVQAVYIPKKLHAEMTRMTERIAKEVPDAQHGPADPSNLQHFVAMAVAYQMGMATMHLLERNPLVKLVFAFGDVLKDILGSVVEGFGDCDECELADECEHGRDQKRCKNKSEDAGFAETSPLN